MGGLIQGRERPTTTPNGTTRLGCVEDTAAVDVRAPRSEHIKLKFDGLLQALTLEMLSALEILALMSLPNSRRPVANFAKRDMATPPPVAFVCPCSNGGICFGCSMNVTVRRNFGAQTEFFCGTYTRIVAVARGATAKSTVVAG